MEGKIAARKRTAPNSKVREFHVERKCEIYRSLMAESLLSIVGALLSSESDCGG